MTLRSRDEERATFVQRVVEHVVGHNQVIGLSLNDERNVRVLAGAIYDAIAGLEIDRGCAP